MNKFLESNISKLKQLKRKQVNDKTTKATQKRIDEIIKLYTGRKMTNIATAENYIKGLTSDKKRTYDKMFQKIKDNIQKLKKQKPLKERMSEAKQKKENDTYFVIFKLYEYGDPTKRKQRPAFKYNGYHHFLISQGHYENLTATVQIPEFPKN